ncbi:MAG TPA: membrane protein insertase YidC [bacterium]|nr:membrane protein insertase YidC [bacterium]
MSQQTQPFDSKSFLAFGVLLALVLLLPIYWEWIGYNPASAPPKQEATDSSLVAEPVAGTDKSISIDSASYGATDTAIVGRFAVPEGWTEQFVVVSTPKYDAIFSTRGARLVNLVLKNFTYTDAARRGQPLVLLDSIDAAAGIGPRFRFANEQIDLSQSAFTADQNAITLSGADSATVRFTAQSPAGAVWTIAYTFFADRYDFTTRLAIPEPWKDGVERELYFGWQGGLWPTEPDVEGDNADFAAIALMGDKDLEKVGGVDRENPVTNFGGLTRWAAVRTKYFVSATIPRSHEGEAFRVEATERPFFFDGVRHTIKAFSASVRTQLRAGEPIDQTFSVYIGPIDYDLLKSYKLGLEEMVDLGWRWIVRPFSLLFLWLFQMLYAVFSNYGVVIIVFALIIKAIFHPLTKKQVLSMRKMQALAPKMEKLKERFKSDPARMNQEMMKLYKEAGINPLSGCLPLLPQLPIFYALFQVFRTTIELRGAPFAGWLTDLSQKDPYYILPIIMTVSMFVQQKLSSSDPKQKMLLYLMPLIFGFMFRNFPAGLTLYWTMFNIFSIVEQVWLIGHPSKDNGISADGEVGTGKIISAKTT